MQATPVSNRLHIAILGRRNAGKSSLINALANQDVSLVSEVPGTTTDPVYKAMEILPIGPVVLIDTAGIDDSGELGDMRVLRTKRVLAKSDLAVLVVDATRGIGDCERSTAAEIRKRGLPAVGVVNKTDLVARMRAARDPERAGSSSCHVLGATSDPPADPGLSSGQRSGYAVPKDGAGPGEVVELELWGSELGIPLVPVSSKTREGLTALKEHIIRAAPRHWDGPPIIGDLVRPGETVVLVVPVDVEAPKGRLILPQVQTLRDILDTNARAVVVKEDAVGDAIDGLRCRPALVVTDSQAFGAVSDQVPRDVPLTSFSILFARHKGDLSVLVEGARRVGNLQPGANVLIAEACTHHPIGEDIARVKIPAWLERKVGGKLRFSWATGTGFPEDLARFDLVVHCGGCMISRTEMLRRLSVVKAAGVPVVNYGVLIAYLHGVLDRALQPIVATRESAGNGENASRPGTAAAGTGDPSESAVFCRGTNPHALSL